MVELVDRFAVDLMDHEGKQRALDEQQVKADLRIARWIGDRGFYIGYNCDRRGRLSPLQTFNYHRQDHVRSLFRFARGQQLGLGDVFRVQADKETFGVEAIIKDVDWLEIHVANTEGKTDKESWPDRQRWVAKHRDDIVRVAADPVGTFDLWRNADKPFAFVAACRELAQAWDNPRFETHLPIGFDGSCNALQHLALLCLDLDVGRKVNLVETKAPQDIYAEIIAHVRSELENDTDNWAAWWLDTFAQLGAKKVRKLLKTPAMTFAYGSVRKGKAEQICDEFGTALEWKAAWYLAHQIETACDRLLPGPTLVMDYIRNVARWCHKRKQFLKWTSPTGFPVFNSYYESEGQTINLLQGGQRVRHDIDVPTSARDAAKAINSVTANFVQSLDASHLCRVVNAAADEGINDVICVHDSYACLAPQAVRFNRIIRTQLSLLYACQDHLRSLSDTIAPPPYGDLNPLDVQNAEYCFA
jgi:DNA-directed RNA polymerase